MKQFLETADANLLRYCREDVDLRKILVEARDRGDYELREELHCEHILGEPEQWMVAAGIFPHNGQQILSQPLVDPNYAWHANIQLSYTESSYANASNWLSLRLNSILPIFGMLNSQLLFVAIYQKQILCFDMVIEGVRNEN